MGLRSLTWIVATAASSLACSEEPSEPAPPCPRGEPTFRVELTAPDENLPEDLVVTVRYQGSLEVTYELENPTWNNEDVCCVPGSVTPEMDDLAPVQCAQHASAGAAAEALRCELWTSGIAEVSALAIGYAELVESLQPTAREDGCGLETTDERLELEFGDAGVLP